MRFLRKFSGRHLPIIFALLAFPFLLSRCDMMGSSIDDFIDFNTGNARVISFAVTSDGSLVKTKQAWMYDPFASDGFISIELAIDNPQNYDLAVTPVISEYIGEDGIRVSNPPGIPISYNWVPGKANTVSVQIGDSDHNLHQGDSFKVRLDMATKDGIRVFDSFRGIPQIVYDNVLWSPQAVQLEQKEESEVNEEPYPGYKSYITWSIQPSSSHVGINEISLTFSSKAGIVDVRHWDYRYKGMIGGEHIWEMEGVITSLNEHYRYLKADASNENFVFPFPFFEDPIVDSDGWVEGFSYRITLKDKNGLTAIAGEGVSPETELDDLIISYHYRGTPENLYENSGWEFSNKEKTQYKISVPFKVDRIKFEAVKGTKVGEGIQQVQWWGDDSSDMLVNSYQLVIGLKTIKMTVHWENPDALAWEGHLVDEKDLVYTFDITRLNPNKDSTLKGLIIQDAATGTVFAPVGGFQDLSDYDVNNDLYNVLTEYTFHVPSSVSSIRMLGTYLNISEFYDDRGKDLGKAYYPNPPTVIDTLEDDDEHGEQDYDFSTLTNLELIQNGWVYPLSDPKEYYFRLNVKPENDTINETMTRHYFITVVKADKEGNVNAKLDDLTVKADGTPLLAPGLDSNSFSPNLSNYTVYVPSDKSTITVQAEALKLGPEYKAEIRAITCVDLNSNVGDVISIPVTSKIEDGQLSITLPASVSFAQSKLLTLKVYSRDSNPTSRDYTVTLVRCRASGISGVSLTGHNGGLGVAWTGTADSWANQCEAWYSLYNEDSSKNNPEKAIKAPGNFVSGSSLDGLLNNNRYNVWVRSVNTVSGLIGDWKKAQTPPGLVYGIPGGPDLPGFTVVYSPAVGNYQLTLVSDSPEKDCYTLTLPWGTTSADIEAVVPFGSGVACTHDSEFPLSGANLPEGAAEAGSTVTFTAVSPDGRTSKQYEIGTFRLLEGPALTGLSLDEAVSLSWSNTWLTPIPGVSYEVYFSDTNLSPSLRESLAQKIKGIAGTGITVSSLDNEKGYFFWVRAVKDGIPGEWSANLPAITPRSTENRLSGISVTPASALKPGFDPEITSYSIELEAGGPSITNLLGAKGEPTQTISYPDGTTANPSVGGKTTLTVKVAPANISIGSPKIYTLNVYRKPAAPAMGPAVSMSSGSLYLSWAAAAGAEWYEIWHGTEDDPAEAVKLGQDVYRTSPLNATISGLDPGIPHYVWVRSRSIDGITGNFSASVSAVPDDGHPSITVIFPPDMYSEVFTLSAAGSSVLYWGNDDSLTVNVSGTGTSCMWYVDGVLVSGANTSLYTWTLRARELSAALHSISARVVSGGQVFSRTVNFEVVP